jgi:hypothetical protein
VAWFSGSVSATSGNRTVFFRILIDGVVKDGASFTSAAANSSGAVSIMAKAAVAAGARVVKVQWRVSSGTAQIRPATVPDGEGAQLYVEEVSV